MTHKCAVSAVLVVWTTCNGVYPTASVMLRRGCDLIACSITLQRGALIVLVGSSESETLSFHVSKLSIDDIMATEMHASDAYTVIQ